MNARMLGGPGAIAEDATRDAAGQEAGGERRAEGFPCHGTLVMCEAAEGIVPGWGVEDRPRGEARGPPQAIGGSGKARALAVLVEGTRMAIDERVAGRAGETGWGRGERVGVEELHGRGPDERRVAR